MSTSKPPKPPFGDCAKTYISIHHTWASGGKCWPRHANESLFCKREKLPVFCRPVGPQARCHHSKSIIHSITPCLPHPPSLPLLYCTRSPKSDSQNRPPFTSIPFMFPSCLRRFHPSGCAHGRCLPDASASWARCSAAQDGWASGPTWACSASGPRSPWLFGVGVGEDEDEGKGGIWRDLVPKRRGQSGVGAEG